MPPTRVRRIVRRAVMALAVALLPVWYVNSVAVLILMTTAEVLPPAVITSAAGRAYIAPLQWYVRNPDRPGVRTCKRFMGWAHVTGSRMANE